MTLSDVLKHFNRPRNKEEIEDEIWEETKKYFGKTIFPNVINDDSFIGTILGSATDGMGLTKQQAIEIYKLAGFAVACGFTHSCSDEDMNFELTGFFSEVTKMDTDEFVKNYWPKFEKDKSQALSPIPKNG